MSFVTNSVKKRKNNPTNGTVATKNGGSFVSRSVVANRGKEKTDVFGRDLAALTKLYESDYNAYAERAKTNGYRADSREWFDSAAERNNQYKAKRNDVLNYLEANRDSMDSKQVAEIENYIKSTDDFYTNLLIGSLNERAVYSKFNDAEQFDKWLRSNEYAKKYDGITYVDTQKAIANVTKKGGEYAQEEVDWLTNNAKTKSVIDTMTTDDFERRKTERQRLLEQRKKLDQDGQMTDEERLIRDEIDEKLKDYDAVAYYIDNGETAVTYDQLYAVKSIEDKIEKIKSNPVLNAAYEALVTSEDPLNDQNDLHKMGNAVAAITARQDPSVVPIDGYEEDLQYIIEKYGIDPNGTDEYIKNEIINAYNSVGANYNSAAEAQKQILADAGFDWEEIEYYHQLQADNAEREELKSNAESLADDAPVLAAVMGAFAQSTRGLSLIKDTGDLVRGFGADDDSAYNIANIYDNNAGTFADTVQNRISENIGNAVMDKTDSEALSWLAKTAYGGVTSAVQSGATQAIFGRAGQVILGSQAAESAYVQSIKNGSTKEQAMATGIAAGVAEALFEHFSFEKLVNLDLDMDTSSVSNFIKSFFKNSAKIAGQGGIEASEELFTSLSNTITDQIFNGDRSEYNTAVDRYVRSGMSLEDAKSKAAKDFVEGLVGDAVGGFFGGIAGAGVKGTVVNTLGAIDSTAQAIGNKVDENRWYQSNGQRFIDNDAVADLVNAAQGLDDSKGSRELKALADKVAGVTQENASKGDARNVGKLYQGIQEENNRRVGGPKKQALTEKVRNALKEKGVSDVDKATDIIVKSLTVKKPLTSSELRLFNKVGGKDIVNSITKNTNLKTESVEIASEAQYNKQALALKGIGVSTKQDEIQTNDQDKNFSVKSGAEVSNPVFVDTKDGVKIKVSDDESVSAKDISWKNETIGAIYGAVADLGADAKIANEIVGLFDGSYSRAGKAMASDLYLAYNYGYYNYGTDSLKKLTSLTSQQAKFVYNEGRQQAALRRGQEQKKVESAKEKAKGNSKTARAGKVELAKNVPAESERNPIQKANILAAEIIAKLTGVDIYIGFSEKDAKGNLRWEWEDGAVTGANGLYYNGKIYLDLNAGNVGENTMLDTLGHELGHWIKQYNPKAFYEIGDYLMEQYSKMGGASERIGEQQQIISRREKENLAEAKKNGTKYVPKTETEIYDEAYEEFVCESFTSMLRDGTVVQNLAELKKQNQTLWQVIMDAIKALLEKWNIISKEYEHKDFTTEEARFVSEMESVFKRLQEMYTEALQGASENFEAISTADYNAKKIVFGAESINNSSVESGVKRQLREHKVIGDKAISYNSKHSNVGDAILQTGVEVMNEMAEVMLPFLEEDGILPPDIPGKTIFKNGSYGRTGENTTLCVRTLTYEDFKDRVAENIGRPLTVAESLLVSQKIYDIATDPQCIYCYVAADRKSYDAYLGEYWKAMDKYINALKNGGDSKALYEEYLDGRKDTKQQQKRWAEWVSIAKNDKPYIKASDLTTKRKRDAIIAKKNSFSNQVKDAQRYAQSASWAKTVFDYRAYNGEILKMKQTFVDMLNSEYGLRMYSFSDYTPAFIVENMQMIIDASVKGLKSLAYTKDTDYAEIFAPTGQAINVSCFARYDQKSGTYVEDNRQGANWSKTKELRGKFKNVGAVMVCTNDAMVMWALKQDWIDVVIPYHIVKTGTTIANEYDWNNYTSESADKLGGRNATIYPTEHNNDFSTFSRLVEERGITPRFSRWFDMVESGEITQDEYMKLVNEVRLPASELSPVVPKFDLNAAKRSFGIDNDGNIIHNGFVAKGGYMGGWYRQGVDVNQEVMQVSKDIVEGKTSLDVDYGMTKENKAKVEERYGIKPQERDSEGNTLSKGQQEFFKDSKVRDKDGNLLVVYHGTSADFTVFDIGRSGQNYDGNSQFGRGMYFAGGSNGAWEWSFGGKVKPFYVNIKTPFYANEETPKEFLEEVGAQSNAWAAKRGELFIGFLNGRGIDSTEFLKEHGYDGIIDESATIGYPGMSAKDLHQYVVFSPEQIKDISNQNPTKSKDVRYQERNFSYDELVAKGDLTGTIVDKNVQVKMNNGIIDNAWVVKEVKKKCQTVSTNAGKTYYVDAPDIGRNVEVIRDGIIHGFGRPNDIRNGKSTQKATVNARVSLAIPELLKNSIEVNWSKRGNSPAIPYTHVMIGTVGLEDNNGNVEYYAVRSMIQERAIQDPILVDVNVLGRLTSLNAKKIDSPNVQVNKNVDSLAYGRAYKYSIADFLNDVKNVFDSTFSEDVYRHFGMDRTDDDFSKNLLFQERSTNTSNRSILVNALESAAKTDEEKAFLKQYKGNVRMLDNQQKRLQMIGNQLRRLTYKKGKRSEEDKKKLADLRQMYKETNEKIYEYDRKLVSLEAMNPIKRVIQRERTLVSKKEKALARERLSKLRREKNERFEAMKKHNTEMRQKNVEGRQRTILRHKIKKVVGELNHLIVHGTKERNVKFALAPAVRASLLAADRIFAGEGEGIERCLDLLHRVYGSLKSSNDDLVKSVYKEDLNDKILDLRNDLDGTPFSELDRKTLQKIYDVYKMVKHMVTSANKVFREGKAETVTELANSVMEEVRSAKKNNSSGIAIVKKLLDPVGKFLYQNNKPVYVFDQIGSKALTKLYWDAVSAEGVYGKDMEDAQKFVNNLKNKYGYEHWNLKKTYTFDLANGDKFHLNIPLMMSIYAYSFRDNAYEHMTKGGFMFDEYETYKEEGKVLARMQPSAKRFVVNDDIIEQIVGTLTDEQKAYAKEMQKYLSETMGKKGNSVSRELYGVDLFKEDFYFPLKSQSDFLNSVTEALQKTPNQSSLKNTGMTKEVVPHASNPIILQAFDDVWQSHVNKMSQYHALVLPIENLQKVFNYKVTLDGGIEQESVKNTLSAAFGSGLTDYIGNYITDLNGGVQTGGYNSPAMSLFGKFKKASVAGSLSVVIQQPFAVIRAMSMIRPDYFVPLVRHKGKFDGETMYDELKKYAPVAIIKEMGGFDVSSSRQATDYLGVTEYHGANKVKGFFTDKTYRNASVDNAFMFGATLADKLGWLHIWSAVKKEVGAKMKDKVGTEEYLKACGKRFTEVIVYTQVYDSVNSKSGLMRSKSDLNKFATSFMGEPTTTWNMIVNSFIQLARNIKNNPAKAIAQFAATNASVFASIVMTSAFKSIIYAFRDDDDDESMLEKWAEEFAGSLNSDLLVANMIPYIRDLVSLYQGWDVERPDMSILADIKAAHDKLNKDDVTTYEKIEEFGGAIASLFGLPVKNVMRDVRGIYNAVESMFDENKPDDMKSAFVRGWIGKDLNDSANIYKAVTENNETLISAIRSKYGTDKKYQTALRKALKENDSRIQEAARARNSGDMSTYKRIAREIANDGNFTLDDVIWAINSSFNSLQPKEEDTSSSGSQDLFKISDYFLAVDNNQTEDAEIVKQNFIDTAIGEGKSKKDAEKDFYSRVRTHIRNRWKDGEYTDAEARKALRYHGGLSTNEAIKKVRDWKKDTEEK